MHCKPMDTPMDPIGKIDKDNDNHPTNKGMYQRQRKIDLLNSHKA